MEKKLNNLVFDRKISKKFLNFLRNRDRYIVDFCKGKKVLHIGATDWPYTKERYKRGDLLYLRIGKVAVEQIGLDLSKDGSNFLNEKQVQNSKIMVCDMNDAQELNFTPDVIILGETLEHLMNLENVLKSLKKIMNEKTELLITVPNAFYSINFFFSLFRKEHQHPDHNVAFTHKTLIKLLKKNNFNVKDFYFTFLEVSLDKKLMNLKGKFMCDIVLLMSRISPVFSETLMVIAKK